MEENVTVWGLTERTFFIHEPRKVKVENVPLKEYAHFYTNNEADAIMVLKNMGVPVYATGLAYNGLYWVTMCNEGSFGGILESLHDHFDLIICGDFVISVV